MDNATVTGEFGVRDDTAEAQISQDDKDTIVSIKGEAFDEARVYRIAIPRNLFKGFCEIEPLIAFGKEHSARCMCFFTEIYLFVAQCSEVCAVLISLLAPTRCLLTPSAVGRRFPDLYRNRQDERIKKIVG